MRDARRKWVFEFRVPKSSGEIIAVMCSCSFSAINLGSLKLIFYLGTVQKFKSVEGILVVF